MTQVPKRFLFNAHNRRGLGHLMRGLNIARAIRRLSSNSDILFYTRSESAADLCGDRFGYFIEEDLEHNSHWAGVIEQFQPHVVIYDTLLPKEAADTPPCKGRMAYIMRKCKPDRQQEIFYHPFLRTVDLILIPHDREDFGYDLPAAFIDKAHFIGPIIRQADGQQQQLLRAKYHLQPDEKLLVSTVGGGGFEDKATAFFQTVFAIHKQIHDQTPKLRHLLIKGPNYTKPLTGVPQGIEIIDSEAEMVNLLAISTLVIAEGGYNTVNEIRLAKSPAIFLPSDRNYDDQFERVMELAAKGLGFAYPQPDRRSIADQIVKLLTHPSLLDGIKQCYDNDVLVTGNATAGRKLVELAER